MGSTRPDLKPRVRVYLRPLDRPETVDCAEHGLPCMLRQHFAIETIKRDEVEHVGVITVEEHA